MIVMIPSKSFCDNVYMTVKTLKPGENGCHFAEIFKGIFLKENFKLWNKMSGVYVPVGPIHGNSAWAEIMAHRRTGKSPISEPMKTTVYTPLGTYELKHHDTF